MKKNKLLVITNKKELNKTIEKIKNNQNSSFDIDSICVLDQEKINVKIGDYDIKTNKTNFIPYLCHSWIDEVLIATKIKKIPTRIYNALQDTGITTNIAVEDNNVLNKTNLKKLYGFNVIQKSIVNKTLIEKIIKRTTDIIGALIGCLFTLLLTIIVGPIIYINSPGSIFYTEERIGLNGRRFKMYKFRSMVLNANELKEEIRNMNLYDTNLMFKIKDDPRVIPHIGRFIRRTSIDEFPQFLNVLKGDMSLVGTRPPTIDEWMQYKPQHRIRMSIMPGITGLWQTSGRSRITHFDTAVEYDKEYIKKWSIGLDVIIIVKTIFGLFKHKVDEAI